MVHTQPRDAKAILFSGGLDSLCAAALNPRHQLIRVATGSQYDAMEQLHSTCMARMWGDMDGGRSLIAVDDVLNLARYEQHDALVPARNALIALVAAQHASELMLVSVAGDGTHATDKDLRFADIMSELLGKLFQQGSVVMPYRKWSKLQLLKAALDYDAETVIKALPWVWSCYGTASTHCGHCKACVRLHGALMWADAIQYGPKFSTDPFTLPMVTVRDIYRDRGHEELQMLKLHEMFNTA